MENSNTDSCFIQGTGEVQNKGSQTKVCIAVQEQNRLPYAEVGKRYGETQFTEEERKVLYWHRRVRDGEPKEVNSVLSGDQEAQDNLVFPLGAVRKERSRRDCSPVRCTGIMGEAGMKVDPAELRQGTRAQY